MNKRLALRLALGAVAVCAILFGGWLLSLPPAPTPPEGAAVIDAAEAEATLAALTPPKRQRPLIAIPGINDGTETTDYLMPYGILRRADVADVLALGTSAGPMELYPALSVQPDSTLNDFDERYPDGADYVIVPAMRRDDDAAVLEWLRSQASKGAIIVGVCVGATIVANAGLLDGKRATTHWYSVDEMLERHPSIRFVPDRRLVVDGGVVTTTGITASMPVSLTLIEAIAGRGRADAVARDLGLPGWDAHHDSSAFRFSRPFAITVMLNRLAFWRHETFGLELTPGMDEVALALVADAWSRTYRSRAVTLAPTLDALPTRSGIRLIPDEISGSGRSRPMLAPIAGHKPAQALDEALRAIEARYGAPTANVVSMQLEYPRRASPLEVSARSLPSHRSRESRAYSP